MGQQQSTTAPSHFEQARASPSRSSISKFAPIEHEGLLKLRTVPFRNSVQVSTSPCLFMQKAEITLANLLEDRYNTTKLFTEEDLTNLLESVLYTLAYLETKNVVYKDLSTENIFYDPEETSFKLFPAQLVKESGYELVLKNRRQSLLSPEMIIGLRCQQQVLDIDLYHKSNMFLLGMIMLECGSLKPSAYCYDDQNLDILDKEIRDRLKLIREFYSERLLKYITMLVEYDYSERIFATDMSLLFNRELTEQKVSRLKKVTGRDVSASKTGVEDISEQSIRKWDQPAGELARSHIDSLAIVTSTAKMPTPQPSFRNHVNMGSANKQSQTQVRESVVALQPPHVSQQNRRSVSPARIPGYNKPHLLSHHSPVPPLKGIPGSVDSSLPLEFKNNENEPFFQTNLARPTSSGFAGGTFQRESIVGESLFNQPKEATFMDPLGSSLQKYTVQPQRLTPAELAQRLAVKNSALNQMQTQPINTPPQLRNSMILKQGPMTSSFGQLSPALVPQQPTEQFNRAPTPPLVAPPPPAHIRFNYIDVSQRYNKSSQSDTYQQSHSGFNSQIKDQLIRESSNQLHHLNISPLQKNSVISQQSSVYPTQFHLISGREAQPPGESIRSSQTNSHSQSQSQDYSIAKIKEEIEKSRRLIQQLQNESKPSRSPDRTASPIQ